MILDPANGENVPSWTNKEEAEPGLGMHAELESDVKIILDLEVVRDAR